MVLSITTGIEPLELNLIHEVFKYLEIFREVFEFYFADFIW